MIKQKKKVKSFKEKKIIEKLTLEKKGKILNNICVYSQISEKYDDQIDRIDENLQLKPRHELSETDYKIYNLNKEIKQEKMIQKKRETMNR